MSFDKLIGRSNTGVLLALFIKYCKQHFAKSAMIFYVQEIYLIQVRRFGSANLSALVNIPKYMYTKRNIPIARRRDGQNKINVISSYSNLLVISWENLKFNYLY